MSGPPSRDPPHFTIFKTAGQEAAEMARQAEPSAAADPPFAAPDEAVELAIHELVFALYAEDVRLGIVRGRDILDVGGALSTAGGDRYRRRATDILGSLARVSDKQIVRACLAEPGGSPRGAAARVELRRRGLTLP